MKAIFVDCLATHTTVTLNGSPVQKEVCLPFVLRQITMVMALRGLLPII